MRNLEKMFNEHLDCKHRTTEVKQARSATTVTLKVRHGGDRFKAEAPIASRTSDGELGSVLFHQMARELRANGHGRMAVGITDEEYAGLVLSQGDFDGAAGEVTG